jgi:hypothetical protein
MHQAKYMCYADKFQRPSGHGAKVCAGKIGSMSPSTGRAITCSVVSFSHLALKSLLSPQTPQELAVTFTIQATADCVCKVIKISCQIKQSDLHAAVCVLYNCTVYHIM